MKMKTKKSLALFAAIMLFCGLSLSCADTASQDAGKDTSQGSALEETVEDEPQEPADYFEARKNIADSLPEADFGGQGVKIMLHGAYKHFVLAEEDIGEVVNDAVYAANRAVEERFNVKLIYFEKGETEMAGVMKNTVNSGDEAYDFAFGHDLITPPLSLDGYFANFYDMRHLDFDKPWWSRSALDEFTILGQCYVTVSPMSYMGIARARVLLLNEDKVKELGLELPYDDVINGKWTIDKLISLTKNTYKDLNGDGAADKDDFYGYITEGACYGYLDNFDIPIMGRDADGKVTLVTDIERAATLIDKLYDWFCASNDALIHSDGNHFTCEEFAQGLSLVQRGQMFEALNALLGSSINYGILPMPKFDELQENYMTSSGEFVLVAPSTITGDELDRLSIIIEAMSAEGYKRIFPAYFKIALQTKYFDNQSVQMLDIINESRRPSFSFVYDNGTGMTHTVSNLLAGNKPSKDFVSYYDKRINQIQKMIDKLNSAFENMAQ